MEHDRLMKMLAIIVVVVIIVSIWVYVAFSGNNGNVSVEKCSNANPIAIVNTTMGDFEIELFEKEFCKDKEHNSINLVKNFEKYALSGFYNGVIIHKVAGMKKGEEACSNGSVGRTLIYTGEYYDNLTKKKSPLKPWDYGYRTDVLFGLKHTDLMVSWFDSHHITSVFYICNGDWSNSGNQSTAWKEPDLDIYDPVFGKVISGVDTIRRIGMLPTHSEVNETGDRNLTCVEIKYPKSSNTQEDMVFTSDFMEHYRRSYSLDFMRNLYSMNQKNAIHVRNTRYPMFSCTHIRVFGP